MTGHDLLGQRLATPWAVRERPSSCGWRAPANGRRTGQILLVAPCDDEHLGLVIAEVERRDLEYEVVCAHHAQVGYDPTEELTPSSVLYRSSDPLLPVAHHAEQVAVVNRHDAWVGASQFACAESMGALDGLLTTARAGRWINAPDAARSAESKVLQISTASRCGLSVPRTLITSNPSDVRSFFDAHNGQIVHKSLINPFVRVGNREALFLYTSGLGEETMDALDTLLVHPALFQARLAPTREHRVTVVGNRAFAAQMSARPEGALDWRRDLINGVTFEPADLPTVVIDAVLKTVADMGLTFAAVDLIETDDDYYFLEANPSGAYAWLERSVGLAITATIVDELCDHAPSP